MPRKRKASENQIDIAAAQAATGNGSREQVPAKKKRAPRRKTEPKKAAAENVDAASAQITDEAIRLRAYFVAEERIRLGRAGDEHSDWLEARRQLIAEEG
jgi:Protein of unknown function (DUF2934)